MDKITRSFLQDFLQLQGFTPSDEAYDFEKFVNYSVVSKEYKTGFKVEDISTGTGQGIDGIAIIVNGKLVTSSDEVSDLIDRNNYLEAAIVFIQAKTSSSFDSSDIGNFFFSIKEMMKENPTMVLTE